jgi:hypothetical protein
MKKLLISLVILVALALITVPACTSSTSDNTQAFCQSLATLAVAEANLKSINATTSVDQARQYLQAFQSAWNDMVNAKQDMAVSKYSDLQNSYFQLTSSLNSMSGSQSVAQALPTIQAAVVSFDANLNAIRTTTCTYSPTKSP